MSTQALTPNILLVVLDDLGADVVDITSIGTTRIMNVHTNDGVVDIYGPLPNISLFLRNGLYFRQAWAQPSCSPTRASIYTGLHPWKSGVGSPQGTPELDASAGFTTLPALLPSNYVSGLFGKWHLGSVAGTRPTDHGWDRHIGTLDGVLPDYYHWSIVDSATGYNAVNLDAVVNPPDYATLRTVKEAAAWINGFPEDVPWFATVAFHSPHDPFHVPPGGYNPATAGNPTPADPANPAHFDYMFNLMVQNVDGNIGRLLGTSGQPGGPLSFHPIPEEQLSNTIIFFIGDNGSHSEIALDEPKTEIYEGSVRIPFMVSDGQAVMNEINGQVITPRFLHASRLNGRSSLLVNAVDLYRTIVRLVDPAANAFPSDTDSKDFSDVVKTAFDRQPPQRVFNFSQWYGNDGTRATIRNAAYKLNYHDATMPTLAYALYQYSSAGRIPGQEDDGTAVDLFADALNGVNLQAQENLNSLLDELIPNYQRDETETETFPDPR